MKANVHEKLKGDNFNLADYNFLNTEKKCKLINAH